MLHFDLSRAATIPVVVAALALVTLLSACGQKGPLFLPGKPGAISIPAKPATAPAADVPPALPVSQ